MKTVLIVEDEKMIRQGLKAMIKRSGVPVEMILECNNGETALEIIKEQQIDAMFTDIRMPKMDGITLVQKMQECEHIPMTIAISGYDDFHYAVEMMRQGVREYLLKPIEREKITEIMQKLEAEYLLKAQAKEEQKKISNQSIKYFMLQEEITEEERNQLASQDKTSFFNNGYYVVCCAILDQEIEAVESYVYLKEVNFQDIIIADAVLQSDIIEMVTDVSSVGISDKHQGIVEIRQAYIEAVARRKKAFCLNKINIVADQSNTRFPIEMIEEAEKQIQENAKIKRVQLLGTNHQEELEKAWKKFFWEVKNGRIKVEDFENNMKDFFYNVEKTYKNATSDSLSEMQRFVKIWDYPNLLQYEQEFLEWIQILQQEIIGQTENNLTAQKMQQAITYMKEHYSQDINMAVVSNLLSMNYSFFSFNFKQFTGKNFVNYLREIRMEEAKKMLSATDEKIIEISQQVGYENEKHFMKTFKACFGISPSEYRKNMQIEERASK